MAAEFRPEPHDIILNCILTPTRWLEIPGPPPHFAMNSIRMIIFAGACLAVGSWAASCWVLALAPRGSAAFLAAAGREKTSLLERRAARAEAIVREARLAANEEALKLRSETEQRLNEREALVNRQLENLVREEKSLRAQREELEGKLAGSPAVAEGSRELGATAARTIGGLVEIERGGGAGGVFAGGPAGQPAGRGAVVPAHSGGGARPGGGEGAPHHQRGHSALRRQPHLRELPPPPSTSRATK